MRLLVDQNVPRAVVSALRARGDDVVWVQTEMPGVDDRIILDAAVEENRIVLTFDKDFGELAFHYGLPASCGVVLFRIRLTAPEKVARRVVTALATRDDWTRRFSVVEEHRIRTRPLPNL